MAAMPGTITVRWCPYVYSNTPITLDGELEVLRIAEKTKRGYLVESPFDIHDIIARLGKGDSPEVCERSTRIRIDHSSRGQLYRMPLRSQKEYWDECRLFALEMGNHYPTWDSLTESTVDWIPGNSVASGARAPLDHQPPHTA
jgi:hypothetical protein